MRLSVFVFCCYLFRSFTFIYPTIEYHKIISISSPQLLSPASKPPPDESGITTSGQLHLFHDNGYHDFRLNSAEVYLVGDFKFIIDNRVVAHHELQLDEMLYLLFLRSSIRRTDQPENVDFAAQKSVGLLAHIENGSTCIIRTLARREVNAPRHPRERCATGNSSSSPCTFTVSTTRRTRLHG